MSKLFVIGNGFDCYLHGLPTKYKDFRDYLIKKHDITRKIFSVPDGYHDKDCELIYDEKECAAYIVHVLDSVSDENWGNLEAYLGDEIFDELRFELPRINFDDDNDNQMYYDVYNREDISSKMLDVFESITIMFNDWIEDNIDLLNTFKNKNIKAEKMLDKEALYLSFNYTDTLERLYGINPDNICHIHGKAGTGDKLYFGHGVEEMDFDSFDAIGSETNFNKILVSLRKNTREALSKHRRFFESLKEVDSIYSCGFSFSDVDMIYIEEIRDKVNLSKVTWYLNDYDFNKNKHIIKTLNDLGFKVEHCNDW